MSFAWALLQLAVAVACARAGGGHSYSGGSHGSYSGGHSYSGGSYSGSGMSSGGGDLIVWWIFFVAEHPLIGVPTTIVVGYLVLLSHGYFDDWHTSSTIARGLEAQGDVDRGRNLEALKRRDPSFDAGGFLKRVEASFLAIQAAWSAMDMSKARALVSDGVMERFTIQLGMMRALGLRNDLSDVTVSDSEILQIESSQFWDVLHVRVAAAAVDRDVALSDGSVVRGGEGAEPFEEVWTFARRPGAKTLAGRGALEGSCPNCGTPLRLLDYEQCSACKSWLNSGEFDWVLCEITQACEWSAREPREVPGLYTLTVKDPALNERFLEDRASVAFWRWQEALWTGKEAPLLPVATDGFCREFAARVADFASYRESAVGMVRLLAAETGGVTDRVHLIVRWSGCRCRRGTDPAIEGSAYHETVMILERMPGVLTDARSGLRSLRCPSCGAAPTKRDCARCEYCSRPFNDGSRQWVLAQTLSASDWKCPTDYAPTANAAGPAAAGPLPKRPEAAGYGWSSAISPESALRVMAAAMAADNALATEELRYLQTFALRQAIPEHTTAALLDAARAGRIEMPRPQSTEEACAFLRGVVIMSLTDGKITKEERLLIGSCAQALELKPADVDDLIVRERTRLFEEARRALAA